MGRYTCTAENKLGVSVASAQLFVEGKNISNHSIISRTFLLKQHVHFNHFSACHLYSTHPIEISDAWLIYVTETGSTRLRDLHKELSDLRVSLENVTVMSTASNMSQVKWRVMQFSSSLTIMDHTSNTCICTCITVVSLVVFLYVVAVIYATASLSWRLWGAVSLSPACQLRVDSSKGSSAWASHPCGTSEERLQVRVQSPTLRQQPVWQGEQHQTLTSARDWWECTKMAILFCFINEYYIHIP